MTTTHPWEENYFSVRFWVIFHLRCSEFFNFLFWNFSIVFFFFFSGEFFIHQPSILYDHVVGFSCLHIESSFVLVFICSCWETREFDRMLFKFFLKIIFKVNEWHIQLFFLWRWFLWVLPRSFRCFHDPGYISCLVCRWEAYEWSLVLNFTF